MANPVFKFVASVLVVAAVTSATAADFQVDPRGSFLRRSGDPGATGPLIVDLNALGLSSGSNVTLTSSGSFEAGDGLDNYKWMVAVFSTSNSLLASNILRRVPGAVSSNLPEFVTPAAGVDLVPTDIAEDFYVDVSQSVVIPTNARYLFVGTYDPYSGNNSDPNGDWKIGISAVPEENSAVLAIAGLGALGALLRFRRSPPSVAKDAQRRERPGG